MVDIVKNLLLLLYFKLNPEKKTFKIIDYKE